MANWCNNTLEIQGDKVTLLNIVGRLERAIEDEYDDRGVFEVLIGKPKSGLSPDKYYGCTDIENVKGQFYFMGDILRCDFESRWSPPCRFVQVLSEIFEVKTELYYEEMGCDFCGKHWYTNGELIDSEEYGYLEGIYKFKEFEMFWGEVEYRIQGYLENEDNLTEDGTLFVEENYPYVDESDKEELLLMYKNEYGNYYGLQVEQEN